MCVGVLNKFQNIVLFCIYYAKSTGFCPEWVRSCVVPPNTQITWKHMIIYIYIYVHENQPHSPSVRDEYWHSDHLSVRASKYTDIFNARNLQQCILDVYPRMLTAWANRVVRLLDAHHHRIIVIIIFWVLERDREWVADALAAHYSLHSQQVSFDLCSPSSNQKFTEKARDSLGCLCDKCTGTRHCKCGTHHFVPCAPLNRAWKWHTMCAFYVAFDNFK